MDLSSYKRCELCARRCRVDRLAGGLGACGSTSELRAARAALHLWEEPPISGTRGAGAIFFSGCSLSCLFCQNREISRGAVGELISVERLASIILELQAAGAHNIDLVTPTHFAPSIKAALLLAKAQGLRIPIVYNTGAYDAPATLAALSGVIDVYLPDFKYLRPATARAYSAAPDYPEVALAAIDEMVRQKPVSIIEGGIMRSGVIIRLLELPGHVAEAKLSLSKLFARYGDRVWFSLMNQYTPSPDLPPPLHRTVTRDEYRELVDYAERLGVVQAFVQDFGTASQAFVPAFDNSGL